MFTKLQSVHVRFHDGVSGDELELQDTTFREELLQAGFHDGSSSDNYELQDSAFRTELLQTVFAALDSQEYPTPSLRALTIKNLTSVESSEVTNSPHFRRVLSKLEELHLSIIPPFNNCNWPEPFSSNISLEEMPTLWLEP